MDVAGLRQGAKTDLLRREPKSHAGAISSSKNFELVAFQDPDPGALKKASQLFPGIPTYLGPDQLYKNEKLDAVVICSNAEHHVKIIQTAISHGVSNILCEKPISLNLGETKQLIQKLKETETKLLINHMRRFQTQNKDLRDYLNRDYINDTLTGNIISGLAFYDKGVFHCGTHIIDLLIFFFGEVKMYRRFILVSLFLIKMTFLLKRYWSLKMFKSALNLLTTKTTPSAKCGYLERLEL